MGLTAPKREAPHEDDSEQQTTKRSLGDTASSILENVPRKRRLDIPVQSGTPFMTASTVSSVCSPEGESHGIIQELPSKKVAECKRRSKSTPNVRVVDNTKANPSSFRSLRVRGQRGGFLSFAHEGKLDDATFEEFRAHVWSTFPEESRKSFSYLDSLWFNLYAEKKAPKEKVLNWIKKKDIFSTKYVLIPIVLWNHWSLLILCNFTPSLQSESRCMLLLDSLQQTNPKRLEPVIRKFIFDIYQLYQIPETMHSIRKIPFLIPKVPQQRDGVECGRFVLYYLRLFIDNAPEDFSISGSEGYPYFMKEDWFTHKEFDNFWKELKAKKKSSSLLE